MTNIGSRLDHDLQTRAQTLHANSAALAKQEKNLLTATKKLEKEVDGLKKVADMGLKELKAVGNLGNFAEVVERDMKILEETLRLVREGDDDSQSGSEGDWEPCRVCGNEGGEEKIVLCDGIRRGQVGGDGMEEERCDGPFHYDCLGLKELPKGPWYCSDCRALNTAVRRTLERITSVVGNEGSHGDVEMGGMDENERDDLRLDTPAAFQRQDGTWS